MLNDLNIYKNLGIGILASCKSRRLEQNKAFLKLGEHTFLDRAVNTFNKFNNVYISTNSDNKLMDTYNNVLIDQNQDVGPMEGIHQILRHSNCEYNFIFGVDMPFINEQVSNTLFEFIDNKYDCYVFSDGQKLHPTCTIYSKSIIHLIEDLIYSKKYCLLAIFDNSNTKVININDLSIEKKFLTNINTIDDFDKYCK